MKYKMARYDSPTPISRKVLRSLGPIRFWQLRRWWWRWRYGRVIERSMSLMEESIACKLFHPTMLDDAGDGDAAAVDLVRGGMKEPGIAWKAFHGVDMGNPAGSMSAATVLDTREVEPHVMTLPGGETVTFAFVTEPGRRRWSPLRLWDLAMRLFTRQGR